MWVTNELGNLWQAFDQFDWSDDMILKYIIFIYCKQAQT